jgi:DNA-binding NarL/FixJ family response regulator
MSPALTLSARVARADGIVDKSDPIGTLLAAIRRVGAGQTALPPVPAHGYDAAAAALDEADLPVFAMLMDREPIDSIAGALRIDPAEASHRARRIMDRLQPRASAAA